MENSEQPKKPRDFFSSKSLKLTIFILGGLILIVGSFALGVKVGLQEEWFTQNWAKNYQNNFGGPGPLVMPPQERNNIINPHGIVGVILSKDADNSTLVIKGSDNVEKTVSLEAETTIRQNFDTLKPQDLKANETIIVIGEPQEQGANPGVIDAKFIRVLSE